MRNELENLRRSAKKLKKSFAAGDSGAVARVRAFVPEPKVPVHADFLFVIAREEGHNSWPALKFAFEARSLTREQRAERLKMALYFGQAWVVKHLLKLDSDLCNANLGLQIATYDLAAVRDAVDRDPAAATELIGVRTPILHLAYSKFIHMEPNRADAMLAIAELLLAGGADVNDGFAPEPGSDHKISALYGALGHANNMVLARWLLERGASPDDNESLYHATELGHHDGLKLLMEFGVETKGTNALLRALDFDDTEAVRLLLEYGADPNESANEHPSGQPVPDIPSLHQAARRMCSAATARVLLDHGANPSLIWQGHTAYATARIYGNREVSKLLEATGNSSVLSPSEEMLAACADGKTPDTALNDEDLSSGDRRLLTQLVWEPCNLDHVKALVEAGLDPNVPEEMGLTPLHVAAWEGLPDHVEYFLTLDPDLTYRNSYGGDALGTTIHGAEFCIKASKRDHVKCARLLLEAGAELRQELIDDCGDEELSQFLQSWRDKSSN